MTPLVLAIAWVNAGGKAGPEREALVRAIRPNGSVFLSLPSVGRGSNNVPYVLGLWKAAAKRALKGRGSAGAKPAPRVPRTVLVTERMASALDRGETVTITGATLAVTP